MSMPRLSLAVLPDLFAICKLQTDETIPSWALSGSIFSLTRTLDELSILCPQELVPEGVQAEKGWKSLKIEGKLDFSLVGILSSLASSLAQVGVSLLAISTYDTDYLFVKESDLDRGVAALRKAGHDVH